MLNEIKQNTTIIRVHDGISSESPAVSVHAVVCGDVQSVSPAAYACCSDIPENRGCTEAIIFTQVTQSEPPIVLEWSCPRLFGTPGELK